jgi:hypothetical protein
MRALAGAEGHHLVEEIALVLAREMGDLGVAGDAVDAVAESATLDRRRARLRKRWSASERKCER